MKCYIPVKLLDELDLKVDLVKKDIKVMQVQSDCLDQSVREDYPDKLVQKDLVVIQAYLESDYLENMATTAFPGI